MVQIFEDGERIRDDRVRFFTFHMTDKPDATGIVFVARIIKALFCWESGVRHFRYKRGRAI